MGNFPKLAGRRGLYAVPEFGIREFPSDLPDYPRDGFQSLYGEHAGGLYGAKGP
jgi:hypothetical protein